MIKNSFKNPQTMDFFTAPPGLVRPKQVGHTTLNIILYMDGGAKAPRRQGRNLLLKDLPLFFPGFSWRLGVLAVKEVLK